MNADKNQDGYRRLSAAEYALLFLGLLGRRFFHFGSGFLQVLDNLTIQFIDAGLAIALREILRPLLADGYFFGPLAIVRDHAGIEYGLSATFFGELGGGQVAQFIDQVLHAGVVHGFAVGGPLVASLRVARAFDLHATRVAEPEVEHLFIAEIVHAFVQGVGQIGVGFVHAFHGGTLGEHVLLFVAADFHGLGAAGVGDGDGGHLGGRGELFGGVSLGEIHLGVFQFADQTIDGGAIGAQGTGLDDLPLVLAVFAEFHGRTLGGEFHAREFVGIEGEEALVAQVVGALVEAGLDGGGDGDHLAVIGQFGVGAGAVEGVVADQQAIGFAVLADDLDVERGHVEAVGPEVGGLLLHYFIGGEVGERGDHGGGGVLIGRHRLGGGHLPFAVLALEVERLVGHLLDFDFLELVVGNGQQLGGRVGGGCFGFVGLGLIAPPRYTPQNSQKNDGDEESFRLHWLISSSTMWPGRNRQWPTGRRPRSARTRG